MASQIKHPKAGLAKRPRHADLTGQTFNSLTVVEWRRNSRYGSEWLCRCVCGNERVARGATLRNGRAKSCGCTMKARLRELRTEHGMSRTPTWNCWEAMLTRCSDPKHRQFHRYGGRGIEVCDRWKSFPNFFADMGERPSKKHSIDRDDNDGNYEPGNCRWATMLEQQNNRSTNLVLEFSGRTQTLTEWARELGMAENTLRGRIRLGWTVAEAFSRPVIGRSPPGTGPRSRKGVKPRGAA